MKSAMKEVIDFLIQHPQISRISIIGDMRKPESKDNTMGTVRGIASCLSQEKLTEESMRQAYVIISILQASFLRKDTLQGSIGVNFYDKKERNRYIDWLIDCIVG